MAGPPSALIPCLVQRIVVAVAQRHGELVRHLEAERPLLREAKMLEKLNNHPYTDYCEKWQNEAKSPSGSRARPAPLMDATDHRQALARRAAMGKR